MDSLTHPPIVGIVGRSGAGKTTLLETLIPELKRRGYRVGTIKHHTHPGFEIDVPGKDTWRHAQAGSDHVVIVAPDKVAAIRRVDVEPDVLAIAATMGEVDVILTDGYKHAPIPRIEVVRAACSPEPVCAPEELIALVSDLPLDLGLPRFGLDEAPALAAFIEQRFLAPGAG